MKVIITMIIIFIFVALLFLLRRSWFFYKEINAKSKDNNIKMELLDFLFALYAKGECGFKDYFEAKHIKIIAVYGSGRVFNLLREEIELPPLTMIHVLDISTQKKSIHISILEDIFNKHWDIYQVSTTPRIKNIKSIIERSSYYIMIKNDVKLFVLFQNNLLIIKELEYDVDLNKITVFDERYKMIDNIVNA